MTKSKQKKNKTTLILVVLGILVFIQALVIGKLWTERTDKVYEVNLVKINSQKDSINYLKMKQDLVLLDGTIRDIHSFLSSKNVLDSKIETLSQDSLSSALYLSKQSNRYSQYLIDLEKKLQQVPLGMPSDGYISSNFGKRKNPIPYRTVMAAVKPSAKASIPTPAVVAATAPPKRRKVIDARIVEEKDSLGNSKKVVIPIYAPEEVPPVATPTVAVATVSSGSPTSRTKVAVREENNAPAEKDQIQFHKGLDIAVAFGSDVRCTAQGKVIFAGQKGGYGNCVIVSHGNGLATLYAHLSQILVQTNDQVKVNQVIAKSGNSGRSTGPHLHYEVHKNNTPVNPKLFMSY